MTIEHWSRDVIFVHLPQNLQDHAELQTVVDMLNQEGLCNVVVDFSEATPVGSPTFARLLELRQILQGAGHKLILCGLSPATKGVFTITRLDRVFEFADDRCAALAGLQEIG